MYPISIELGKVREFARAVHARSSAHDGEHPVVPPTFLTTAGLLWEPDDRALIGELNFDLTRLLHGEEEFSFTGSPPRAGTTLTVTPRIAERFEREGRRGGTMRVAVLVREFGDDAGDLVAEQRTTLIETAKAPTGS